MISTIHNWRTKEQLREITKKYPHQIHLVGKDLDGTKYDGYVRQIFYGDTIVVTQNKKTYYFKQERDGTFNVY